MDWISETNRSAGKIAACVAVCLSCQGTESREPAWLPIIEEEVSSVDAVQSEGVEKLHSEWHIATVVAPHSAEVASSCDGVVSETLVKVGDFVSRGDVLAVLEDAATYAEARIAQARLGSAKARLRKATIDVSEAEGLFERAEQVEAYVPQEELENLRFAVGRARAAKEEALEGVAEEERRAERLERMVADARVVAPFAGFVSAVYVEEGMALPRGGPVVRLFAEDGLRVRFAVPFEESAGYGVGADVDVRLSGVHASARATVRSLSRDLDRVTQMVIGEAEFEALSAVEARVGMVAWVAAVKRPSTGD